MNLELNDIISKEYQSEIQYALSFATGMGVVFIDKIPPDQVGKP